MNDKKLVSWLGLAQRAGKAVSGEFAVEKSIRSGKVKCLIIAADASDNTKKSYIDIARHYNVACYASLSKEELSNGIGKENRAAIAIIDAGIADELIKLFDERN